ncbi:MAG: restriction endonuclease subunit S, partial [Pseudomonadota bacterium]
TDPAEEKVVAAEPLNGHAEQGPDINLPDSDRLPDAFGNAEAREALMTQWLEAYRTQLGDAPFSLQRFMVAAQSRLEELLPDTSFMSVGVELGANNHEHIKDWVFKSLAAGTLTQIFDETGSSIQLKTVTL